MKSEKKIMVRKCCVCQSIQMREGLADLVRGNYEEDSFIPPDNYSVDELKQNGFDFSDTYFSIGCARKAMGDDVADYLAKQHPETPENCSDNYKLKEN
jgi:hypothetical protein